MSWKHKLAALEKVRKARRCPRCFGMGLIEFWFVPLGEEPPPNEEPNCPICGEPPYRVNFMCWRGRDPEEKAHRI